MRIQLPDAPNSPGSLAPGLAALNLALVAEIARREKARSYQSLVHRPGHPLNCLTSRTARYISLRGGRGSGKSRGVSESLIEAADSGPERILCTREFQSSISDSVHMVLRDQIERMGLSHRFEIKQAEIVNRFTGSTFRFKGLRMHWQEIKSMEGITKVWVEEAENTSDDSLKTLLPTIRTERYGPNGELWPSQIILTWNVPEEDAPIFQQFGDPESLALMEQVGEEVVSVHINYDENPFFPEVLRRQMEYMKLRDPDAYRHIWLGEPLKRSKAEIFGGRWRVMDFPDDLYKKAPRLHFGADFGFAEDPSTLIRCFIIDNRLYIEYEAYGMGVELNQMETFYKGNPELNDERFTGIPGVETWPIKCDNARPETISFLCGLGFNASAAKKWSGSVEDGISHIRGFDEIIIHPRCKHTQQEAKLYRYKVDQKTGDVLPIVVDKHNHCFPAGVLITTERGQVPIELVTPSDRVLTRAGWKAVLWSGATGTNRSLVEVMTQGGKKLECTPDHSIYYNGQFARADAMRYNDDIIILRLSLCELLKALISGAVKNTFTKFLMGLGIRLSQSVAIIAAILQVNEFTRQSGSTITAQSPWAMKFTTEIKIKATTLSGIWTVYLTSNIVNFIGRKTTKLVRKFPKRILSKLALLPEVGIRVKKAVLGIKAEGIMGHTVTMFPYLNLASTVGKNSSIEKLALYPNFVVMPANQPPAARLESTTLNLLVPSADMFSLPVNESLKRIAVSRVQCVRAIEKIAPVVYDLTIEGQHEFFANGILVHNCWDAIRYSLDGHIQSRGGLNKWAKLAGGYGQ